MSIYFAALRSWYNPDVMGSYMVMRCGVGSILCVFSRSLTPFLKGENRYSLILVRDTIESTLFVSLLIILYTINESATTRLSSAGYAYLISNGVVGIWMFIVIMKISFLDVEYRGVARFQFRRLSPVRPKILLQILGYTLPALLDCASTAVIYLTVVLLLQNQIHQGDFQFMQFVRILAFTRVQGLFECFTLAGRDIFQ